MRVLLADNDPEWLALLALDLGLEGHEIVGQVASGAEVLAWLEAADGDLDVLVVDHRMPPGMFGLDVVREVGRRWPAVTTVLFTNYPDRRLAGEVSRAGGVLIPKHGLRALREAVAVGVNSPRPTGPPPDPPGARR